MGSQNVFSYEPFTTTGTIVRLFLGVGVPVTFVIGFVRKTLPAKLAPEKNQ